MACSVSTSCLALRRVVPAEAALGREIEHLAADHAAEARGAGKARHQRDPHRRIGMGLRPRQDVEGEGQQAVAGEDRGRLVERLVHGRPAAAQIVVVHRRQVVMHQRIAVHEFDRGAGHQRVLAPDAEQRRGLDVRNGRSRLPPPRLA